MRYAAVVVALVAFALPEASAASDPLVARDSHVTAVYALRGTVLYSRGPVSGRRLARPWMRIVGGRRSPARAMPNGQAGSIGIDAGGRIVMTVHVFRGSGAGWWLYDIGRDRARRLRGLARPHCGLSAVAVWRDRTAYVRECGGVFVRTHGRDRRVAARSNFRDFFAFAQRGDSLVSFGMNDESGTVVPVLNRGRGCQNTIAALPPVDAGWHAFPGVWLGAHGVEWVMGHEDLFSGGPYTDLAVMAVSLTGRCSGLREVRVPTHRTPAVQALAIDGRDLYYASADGIHRQRLPAHGVATPPQNDNFEHSRPLVGSLPLHATGTIGRATQQRGEPDASPPLRSVWYSWRAETSQTVTVSAARSATELIADVFGGGPGLSTLTRLSQPFCQTTSFDAVAGQTYWIRVASSAANTFGIWGRGLAFIGYVSYEPFGIDISEGTPSQPAC